MIKTLLFDFGDVFINLDKAATFRELKKLGLEDFSSGMMEQNQLYEMGKISSEEFVNFYISKIPESNSKKLIIAWNSILLDFPQHRLEFLQQLKEENKYQLILLSNTNDLHISWIKENVSFFTEFKSCFDAFYLSHEINFRKPNADIYEFVLEKHQLQPNEVLFIDDTQENTEAAKSLGIHTWNIDPNTEDVVDLFSTKSELF
ncbi:putative hydrolase of the HAD superfamily [Mesonia phycicola]|uniref:Putative hydrolase of the HAD superfamily n=1 Tax=Mesonia phycicola TaxID=579105 RepID=A0A1M6FHQ3_9FLAO|nr:HAD family phosphatase [Mesonia phycicola]SHI97193.1 putative hydrolase of the HAD superfamily [Mesonia phycicola]